MQWPVVSLYLLFGQYWEPEESSLNAPGSVFWGSSSGSQASSSSGAEPTAHWDWGPVASAAPKQHWDSWGFPVVEPAPEQPAAAPCQQVDRPDSAAVSACSKINLLSCISTV